MVNEILIFVVLVTIGLACGVPFGRYASRNCKGLPYGVGRAVLVAAVVTFLIVFGLALDQHFRNSEEVMSALTRSFGTAIFYGFYPSILAGVSALVSSWIAFRSTGPV